MKGFSSEIGIVYFFHRQLYYALHSQLGQVQKFYGTNIYSGSRERSFTITLMTFQLDVEGTATPLSTW